MSELIRLTGLWRATSQAGQEYLSGDISPTARLVIMPNTSRSSDREPEFIAFLAPAGYQDGRPARRWQDESQEQEEDGVQLQWWQKD